MCTSELTNMFTGIIVNSIDTYIWDLFWIYVQICIILTWLNEIVFGCIFHVKGDNLHRCLTDTCITKSIYQMIG